MGESYYYTSFYKGVSFRINWRFSWKVCYTANLRLVALPAFTSRFNSSYELWPILLYITSIVWFTFPRREKSFWYHLFFSLTEVPTGMSPTGRANKKDEERNYNVTLVSIMIPIALSSLLLGGIYCLCKKSVCRKKKEQRKLTKFFTVHVVLVLSKNNSFIAWFHSNLCPDTRIPSPGSTDKKWGINSVEPQS